MYHDRSMIGVATFCPQPYIIACGPAGRYHWMQLGRFTPRPTAHYWTRGVSLGYTRAGAWCWIGSFHCHHAMHELPQSINTATHRILIVGNRTVLELPVRAQDFERGFRCNIPYYHKSYFLSRYCHGDLSKNWSSLLPHSGTLNSPRCVPRQVRLTASKITRESF